jgi:hypothetical protein
VLRPDRERQSGTSPKEAEALARRLTAAGLTYLRVEALAHAPMSVPTARRGSRRMPTYHWAQMGTEQLGALVSLGRYVVADRLHATVLALLLGRPVVALDDSYGSVYRALDSAFDAAAADEPACADRVLHNLHRAGTLSEAAQIIVRWARARPPRPGGNDDDAPPPLMAHWLDL